MPSLIIWWQVAPLASIVLLQAAYCCIPKIARIFLNQSDTGASQAIACFWVKFSEVPLLLSPVDFEWYWKIKHMVRLPKLVRPGVTRGCA